MKKQVVVIAGPTGSGETTFTDELASAYPQIVRAVSATTRPPRGSEVHGRDYFFFSQEEFFELVQDGTIPEYTRVKQRDAWYGTYKPDLEEKIAEEKIVVVNTDLSGAQFFKEQYHATTIFIKPKSLDVLRSRLERRDPSIADHELDVRIAHATQEIAEAENQYDYVVFNTDGEFADTMYDVVEILRREGYDIS